MSVRNCQEFLEELFATHGRVEELHMSEEFTSHMAEERRQYAKHAVSAKEVRQVHSMAPEYFANRGVSKRAPIIMIGPTLVGRMVVVPIEPTQTVGVWHPVTAFEANAHDRHRYEERTPS